MATYRQQSMADPYKAKHEHWADIEAWVEASSNASTDHCILELRDRIQALELALAKPNRCPTDDELNDIMHAFVLGGESPEDFSFDHCGYARAVLQCWGYNIEVATP